MVVIELREICGGYGKKQILHDISALFEKGKVTGVIGPNGSGKSTLIKTIAGINPHTGGSLTVDGEDISEMQPGDTAKKIAYLAQGKAVPDMTAQQMVLHGRFAHLSYPRVYRQIDREIARSAMEQMGIADLAGKRMTELSGGMRQNAYIAMALAQSTDYILLDEPTTYLDIANQLQLMRTVTGLAEDGKGIIIVLHDLPLAMEFCGQIAVMNGGRLLMKDRPEAVFASGIIEEVFGVKLKQNKEDGFSYYYSR